MKKLFFSLLVLLTFSLGHAQSSNDAHDAASRYWRTLRSALDGFFVPENRLLQLRFFDGRVPTAAEVDRKKAEVTTLGDLVIADLAASNSKPLLTQTKEFEDAVGLLTEMSFWGISGSDAEQQLKLCRAFHAFSNAAQGERARLSAHR